MKKQIIITAMILMNLVLVNALSVTINSPIDNSNYNVVSTLFNVTSDITTGAGSIVPNLDNSLVSWWRMDDIVNISNPSFAVNTTSTRVRNNFGGAVGFTFRVLTPITVSQLGRLFYGGSSQNHNVTLWVSTDTTNPLAKGNVLVASASDVNGFKWVSVTPVTLTPGNLYAIASDEYLTGDNWTNGATGDQPWYPILQPPFKINANAYVATRGAYPSSTYSADNSIYGNPAMNITYYSITDYMGKNNETNGASIQNVSGKFGKSMDFNGAGTYINITNPGSVFDQRNLTISAWINPTHQGDSYQRIVDRVYNGQFAFYIRGGGSDKYLGGSLKTSGTSFDSSIATCIYNVNTWQHVVMSYNGTGASFYINGAYCGSGVATGSLSSSTSNIVIGQSVGATGNFNGSIDDVQIYNRSLTSQEVLGIYNATALYYNLNLTNNNHTYQTYIQNYSADVATSKVSFNTNTNNCWNKISRVTFIPIGCLYNLNQGVVFSI
jgi:hypothetical protein